MSDETIHELAVAVRAGFEKIDRNFASLDRKFGAVDRRFERLEKNLEVVGQSVREVGNKVHNLDLKMIGMEWKAEISELIFNTIDRALRRMNADLKYVDEAVGNGSKRMNARLTKVKSKIEDIATKIDGISQCLVSSEENTERLVD
jgi:archaellum component FlaC